MARVTGGRDTVTVMRYFSWHCEYDWWRNKSLVEKNAYMLENEIDTDVVFIFPTKSERITDEELENSQDENVSCGQGLKERNPPLYHKNVESVESFVDCPADALPHQAPSSEQPNEPFEVVCHEQGNANSAEQSSSNAASSLTRVACELPHEEDPSRILPAHRFMIMTASAKFWRLLQESYGTEEIVIRDVEPDIFKLLLRFIYTEGADVTRDTVIPLLSAARLYELPLLVARCAEWLESDIAPSNACWLLEKSLEIKQEALTTRCLNIIQYHTTEAFESPAFLQITNETLAFILASDILFIAETQVFHFCSIWATNQLEQSGEELSGENIRKVLGPALYKIRFPTLSMEDFTSLIIPTNVLSKEDELLIFRCLSMGVKGKENFPFETKQRIIIAVVEPEPSPVPTPPLEEEPMDSAPSTSRPEGTEETEPKAPYTDPEPAAKPKKTSNGLLVLCPEAKDLVKVHNKTSPAEFLSTLTATNEALLVQGVRLAAPALDRMGRDEGSAPGDEALAFVTVVNTATQETLLLQRPIRSSEVRHISGFAFVDVKTTPFCLFENEETGLNVMYSAKEDEYKTKSIFKSMFNFASKAMKTDHFSFNVQVIPGTFHLMNHRENKLTITGSPTSPILGLHCEAT